MADTSKDRKPGIQVIARAAAVLRALEGEAGGLSLGRIASRTGLPRSTVQRIVGALEAEGWVMAASPEGRVRLGPALARLAMTARADMARIAHPYLEELSRRINETVDFAVLDGDDAVFIDQVVAPNQLRAEFSLGDAFPMHCSAHGKAIPRAEALAEAELPDEPGRVTHLMEELGEVRRTGLAFDREEHIKGICAVSAAVRDSLGGVGAISVPVPATRFYDNEDTLTAALLEFCRRIETALGSAAA
ncbi:MAG: IclR family transcriptional regulator [Rhodospirillales bacterium]|nr:IclR family transcriptional regulator [Rhodospirillales bacterium]